MKNRFIFHSVAQLVRFKAVKASINFKTKSKISLVVHLYTIMLSSKQFGKAGY